MVFRLSLFVRLLLAAGLSLELGCRAAPEIDRVVVVTLDTLRADRVGCYGAERAHTPTLDGLAERGVRFTTAIAPTPLTLPSHASLMTGLEPPRHGVRHNGIFRLPEDVPTLAESFREAGYATAAAVGAVVLDRQHGLDRGFDHYDDAMSGRKSSRTGGYAERTADQVVDSVTAWLEEAPERFFLWVHFYDPHADYTPPSGFKAAFPGDPYAGEIAFADAELGRLLDAIQQRFPGDRTLVVVTSDHGESLGEHGELSHSLTIYDATQRVPLLMAGPGLPSGKVVETPVGLVDVAPTLLSLAGLPALRETSGIDLGPVIEGRALPERVQYVETLAPQLSFGWSPLLGVRSPDYKYVRAPRPELYDLSHDARETHDLSGERPELVAELDAVLAERLARTREGAPLVSPGAEHREHLEALGYVVPEAETVTGSLESAQGLDPKDGLPIVVGMIRAMTLMTEHRFDEALAAMEELGDGGWFLEVQRSHAAIGARRLEDAERYARAAVELARGHRAPPYLALGSVLERRGDLDAAAAAFEKVLSDSALAPEALVGLGRVAERRGDSERAGAFYEQAIGSRGSSREARWRLAALHIEEGDEGRAEALLAELPDRIVESPAASIRLARAEARAGMQGLGRARLERSREAYPHSQELEEAWKNATQDDASP